MKLPPLLRKHPYRVGAIIGVGLLIFASYFPFWWLILFGWGVFGVSIGTWVHRLPDDDPYKLVLYLAGFFTFIFLYTIRGTYFALVRLLTQPSGEHLLGLLLSRTVLFIAVLYFFFVALLLRAANLKYQRHCTQQCAHAPEYRGGSDFIRDDQ